MNHRIKRLALAAALGLTVFVFDSCETTGESAGYYDSGGFGYDPWYYGGYYDDADLIVTPPGDRPDRPDRPVAPSHPIARPPIGGGFGGGGGGFRGGGGRR